MPQITSILAIDRKKRMSVIVSYDSQDIINKQKWARLMKGKFLTVHDL